MPKTEGPRRGSTVRYVLGLTCLVLAFVMLPGGCIQMVRTLDRGGYGTSGVDYALWSLAAGGGFLALGIALLIWEVSVRHNIRH